MYRREILTFLAVPLWSNQRLTACGSRDRGSRRIVAEVTSVSGDDVEVLASGRRTKVVISQETRIVQGRATVDATALRPGARVVVEGRRRTNDVLDATEIRVEGLPGSPSTQPPVGGGHKH